jgi:hypothetical protein
MTWNRSPKQTLTVPLPPREEFNPEALVRGVQDALGKNEADDKNRAL